LLQHYPDGRLLVPHESLSKYQRAETLLRRSLAIAEAQRKAGPRQGLFWGESGDPRLTDRNSEINAHLGLADINGRLGKTDAALQQAREAQAAGPGYAAVYQRLHDALLAAGRRAEAQDALLEGVLLTSDPVLMRMLAAGYAAGPGEYECAISYARGAPEIDASCGMVRRQVCAVSDELVRLGMKAGDPELVSRLRNELAAKYACP
jgi:tetratricopeptide (TPR) repeat protein